MLCCDKYTCIPTTSYPRKTLRVLASNPILSYCKRIRRIIRKRGSSFGELRKGRRGEEEQNEGPCIEKLGKRKVRAENVGKCGED